MMTMGRVKNWEKFQHYRDRCPPWIKLQRELLDDYEFACLPLASKALAPLLWLLASETKEGEVRVDPEWLAFRLRWSLEDATAGVTALIEKGFVLVAITPLAECERVAIPEGEAEAEAEGEGETEARARRGSGKQKLQTWLDELGEGKAIPADDPIFEYAEKARIPLEFLELSWKRFCEDMTERGTLKANWRAHYRNAVRGNWYKIWWLAPDGTCQLTTVGKQAQRVAA